MKAQTQASGLSTAQIGDKFDFGSKSMMTTFINGLGKYNSSSATAIIVII